MAMNANVELVADRLLHLARPGGVVLVDSQFFTPLIEVLRSRTSVLRFSVRTAHFEDPVGLLQQALVTPKPEIACCPEGSTGEECECLRKAHMLLEQLGIPIIETHEDVAVLIPGKPDHFAPTQAAPTEDVAA
jgi:hypothetical protein